MELVVQPLDRVLQVRHGDNLLQVLRDNDIPVSYSCLSGRCGTCRCKLVEGNIQDAGPESVLTGPNGRRHILACMSTVSGSCVIEIPEPDEIVTHPAKILKATVVSIEDMTHDIRRILLKSPKTMDFSPGQYATLQFAPDLARPYSMAGVSSDALMEFHIRAVPDGRVTGYVFSDLKEGDTVRVSGPLGTAFLRTKHDGPMLCVASGTGLAPVLSIVRGALEGGMQNLIHVYVGARAEQDIYGMEWLQALQEKFANLHVHVVVSGEAGSKMRSGLVTDAVDQDWDNFAGWRAYLCGSPAMVEAAAILVRNKGIHEDHVYADAFYPSGI